MPEYRITRIFKPGGSESTTDHITRVWIANFRYYEGSQAKQGAWFEVEKVIIGLKGGSTFFYTHPSSAPKAYLTYQATQPGGREYLKTCTNQLMQDHLLSLPNEADT